MPYKDRVKRLTYAKDYYVRNRAKILEMAKARREKTDAISTTTPVPDTQTSTPVAG